MGRITTFGSLAAAAAVLLFGASTDARSTFTSNVTTNPGNWNQSSSWLENGLPTSHVPGCGDTATIASGDVIKVTDSQKVTTLKVSTGGLLEIVGNGSPARLTLCSTGAPSLVISDSEGLCLLDDWAELRFEESTTISGNGTLCGKSSGAQIVLAPETDAEVALTSLVQIHGALVIKRIGSGDGSFHNRGGVYANLSGQSLTLHSSLTRISDLPSTCGGWTVKAPNARLVFEAPAPYLYGSFYVGPGTLQVHKPVVTQGDLQLESGGTILPIRCPFAYFKFSSCCSGSDCCPPSPVCSVTHCR